MADRSSRKVLMVSAVVGFAALLTAVVLDLAGASGTVWALRLVLFVLMISSSHPARAVYLVDMAANDNRAAYTAVSNTVIGILLLGSGIFALKDLSRFRSGLA